MSFKVEISQKKLRHFYINLRNVLGKTRQFNSKSIGKETQKLETFKVDQGQGETYESV